MPLFTERCFSAIESSLPDILSWVEEQSMQLMPVAVALKLQLAAEEAIVNIVRYAYSADATERPLTLRLGQEDNFYLELEDKGIPFNPLENIKVDPSQPLEERLPGGWGRELIVKMTSAASYDYRNGANIFRLEEAATNTADLPE